MKGFLVFIFSRYYPAGGWNDFTANYPTLPEAIAYATGKMEQEGCLVRAHIVDAEKYEIVWSKET